MTRQRPAARHVITAANVFFFLVAFAMPGNAEATFKVVDGDTLVLQAETIRLEGIDAPEIASNANPAQVTGINVACVPKTTCRP